jgi:hypothetical protein
MVECPAACDPTRTACAAAPAPAIPSNMPAAIPAKDKALIFFDLSILLEMWRQTT